MVFSPIVDTAISLIFLLFLFSLGASFLQEAWSSWTNMRGKLLQAALSGVLDRSHEKLADELYRYPLVSLLLGKEEALPNYIPARIFGRTLLAIVAERAKDPSVTDPYERFRLGAASLASEDLRKLLENFLQHAPNISALENEMVQWFDQFSKQITGRYKKRIHRRLLIVSLGIVLAANFDLFSTVSSIYSDSAMRGQLVDSALQYSGQQAGKPVQVTAEDLQKFRQFVKSLPLPIGWGADSWENFTWYRPLGWLVSALLVSFGAPFWFDLLGKMINLRSTGPKPDEK